MKLFVGLGNPGKEYEYTWHNLGFLVINKLTSDNAAFCSGCTMSSKLKAEILEARWHNEKILMAKPQTYMNLSGESVGAIARYYDIATEDIWVIHDELDLDLGTIRLSHDSSAGGHNGVSSIIKHLGTKEFLRFRLGVSTELREKIPAEDYVLQKIPNSATVAVQEMIAKTCDALEAALTEGKDAAMNRFNALG